MLAQEIRGGLLMGRGQAISKRGRGEGDVASYIVRVYRRRAGPELIGTVEFPERATQLPFHSFEELRGILRRDGLSRRTR